MTAQEVYDRHDLCSLPFNPAAVARQLDIALVTYQTLCAKGITPSCSQDGFAFLLNGEKKIAYNSEISSLRRQRWTLTHELSHFLLGHVGQDLPDRRTAEQQANRLTSELLCPAAVLHLCGVTTAAEIAELCKVSLPAATIALERLQALRRCGDPIAGQRQLIDRMLPFISARITAQSAKKADSMRYRAVDIL